MITYYSTKPFVCSKCGSMIQVQVAYGPKADKDSPFKNNDDFIKAFESESKKKQFAEMLGFIQQSLNLCKDTHMQAIGMIVYFGISLVQMAAIIGGLENWLGLHWLLSVVLAFVVTWVPLLGTVLGVGGAMTAWHWEWWQAGGLFVLPLILSFMIGAGATMLERFRRYQ